MSLELESIYNYGGGGVGYKDGGEITDSDFMEVKNNALSYYDNAARGILNFYIETKDGEITDALIEIKTAVNATINVYVVNNSLYYILGYIGSNTINAGKYYKIIITGNSYDVEEVSNVEENAFAEIGGVLCPVKQINNILWTVADYSKIIGTKFTDDSDKWYQGSATRTATGTCLYNMAALNIINDSLSGGWNIATLDDFKNLFEFVGGTGTNYLNGVCNQIKKVGSWTSDLNVNNSSGFSSVPTGRYEDGNRENLDSAYYWTRTKDSYQNKVIYVMSGNNNAFIGNGDEFYDYFAVRFCKHL